VLRHIDQPVLTADSLLDCLTLQLLPGMPAFTSSEKALAALRAAFAQRPHVIVVDNLETAADVQGLLPLLQELAGPAKFLLTTRHSLYGETGVFHFRLPELDETDSLALVRLEANRRNLPQINAASDEALQAIYRAVGGNPLALRLVVGQLHVHSLSSVLDNLATARGAPVESLYMYIYRWAWDRLDELPRRALLAMPLVTDRGGNLEYLAQVSGLELGDLSNALSELVTLSLVDARVSLVEQRYTIHNLTRTFLLEQVIRW
jgi:hypothetical protein